MSSPSAEQGATAQLKAPSINDELHLPESPHYQSNKLFYRPRPSQAPSQTYTTYPAPVQNASHPGSGFDAHIVFLPSQRTIAEALCLSIRAEFPELYVSKLWDGAAGPFPTCMFEVEIVTPSQFGALVPWLAINRSGLSVLVHPNCDDGNGIKDHTERGMWLGEKWPLNTDFFARYTSKTKAADAKKADS